MTRTRHPRPSAKAIEAAQEWQAPAGPTLRWTSHEVAEINAFGDEIIRLRIAADGRVGQHMPTCDRFMNVVCDDFLPLTCAPLQSEADARALLDQVRELESGGAPRLAAQY